MSLRLKVFLVVAALLGLALVVVTAGAVARRLRDGQAIEIHRPESVVALAFSPSGDVLLSLEGDPSHWARTVQGSREPSGVPLGPVAKMKGGAMDLAVSRENVLGVSQESGSVTLHSLPKGEPIGELPGYGTYGNQFSAPSSVRFSPTGRLAAAYGVSGRLYVWDLSRRSLQWSRECRGWLGFVFEDAVAFVSTSSSIRVESLSTRSLVTELALDPDVVWCHALSPRGTILVSYPWEAPFKASPRSLPSGKPAGEPLATAPHDRIAFSDDDALVAVVGPETLSILEVATGRSVFFTSFPRRVDASSVVFSPTRNRLAVARDTTIHVFVFRR